MPGHLSLVVRSHEVSCFLAADATYSQVLLKQRIVDGPSANLQISLDTLERIAAFARQEPTVLLPAHDPRAEPGLAERITLTDEP
jgi:glyoxylase-like metal-dependent hydrolase (beta-lactamase superfamily II)